MRPRSNRFRGLLEELLVERETVVRKSHDHVTEAVVFGKFACDLEGSEYERVGNIYRK